MTSTKLDWDTLANVLQWHGWAVVRTSYPHAWQLAPNGTLNCTHNEKPPIVIVQPWQHDRTVVDVVMRGANGNDWYQVSSYGLSVDSLLRDDVGINAMGLRPLTRLDEIIAKVVVAWNAVAKPPG